MTALRAFSVLGLVGGAIATLPLHAYELVDRFGTPAKWPAGAAAFTVNTASFAVGSANSNRIKTMVERLNSSEIAGSSFGATHGDGHYPTVSIIDGANTISLTSSLGPCDTGTSVARTYYRYGSLLQGRWKVLETDIHLNGDCSFSGVNYYDFNGPAIRLNRNFNIQMILAHELLHAAGLDHEVGDVDKESMYDEESGRRYEELVSYTGWPTAIAPSVDGGAAVSDLGYHVRRYDYNEDERQGLRQLYPSLSNGIDFAVQSYTTPDQDTFNTYYAPGCAALTFKSRPSPYHDLLARAVAEGESFPRCPSDMSTDPQAPLPINRGATLAVAFSLLQLGNISEPQLMRYYLNTTAAPGGTAVKTWGATLAPNVPDEFTTSITIPASLAPGTYHLVLQVDYNNSVSEMREDNNFAVYNRQLNVQ